MKDKLKKGISLCMIVKDEAETVAMSIRSAFSAVDQLVVLIDSASSDNTKDIVIRELSILCKGNSNTAIIQDYGWKGDFAAARNKAIALCDREFVLILDGHERIENANLLRYALESTYQNTDVYLLPILNADIEPATLFYQYRLFRNDLSTIKYAGAIHNYLVAFGRDCWSPDEIKNLRIKYVQKKPLIIHKRPLEKAAARKEQRHAMTAAIMNDRLDRNPLDADALWYTACHELENDNEGSAYEYFWKCFRAARNTYLRYNCCLQIGQIMDKLGDENAARNWYWHAIRIDGCELLPSAWLFLGKIFLEKEPVTAAEWFALAADREFPLTGIPMVAEHFTWAPYWNAAIACGHAAKKHCAEGMKNISKSDARKAACFLREGIEWCRRGGLSFSGKRHEFTTLEDQLSEILTVIDSNDYPCSQPDAGNDISVTSSTAVS